MLGVLASVGSNSLKQRDWMVGVLLLWCHSDLTSAIDSVLQLLGNG